MITVKHKFEAVLYTDKDNRTIGRIPLELDFEPAVESARLAGIRQEVLGLDELSSNATLAPIWHSTLGRPHIEGFEVRIESPLGHTTAHRIPLSYCADAVLGASRALEAEGKIREGTEFNFYVTAYGKPESGEKGSALSLSVKEVTPDIRISEAEMPTIACSGEPEGCDRQSDMPVFIPERVLREAETLTRKSPTKETGGILIGHIHRDSASRELYLLVTEQLAAEYTESTSTQLTFTADTWAAVQAAISLRKDSEIILGFWHSHIPIEWCKRCPPERRKECHWVKGFFSADDRALHRAVFPRAYSIALVETFSEEGVKHDLFGWREGLIKARDFLALPAEQQKYLDNPLTLGEH